MKIYACTCGLVTCLALAHSALAEDFEQNIEKSFQVTPGGKLTVDADRGSVDVKTDEQGQVQIHVFRKVSRGTKADADKLFSNHEVTLTQDGNKIAIIAKKKTWNTRWNGPGMEVRYEISIPKKFDVDLRTAGGNVRLDDLDGTALARTSSGSIKLARITGVVDASDSGGNISIVKAGSSLSAKTSSGSIEVNKAVGDVELSDSGGNISVSDAGAQVKASTSSGSIKIASAGGDIELKDSGGDISVGSAGGSVKASTSSGSIRIKEAKGNLTLNDSGGNIEVGEGQGEVSASTSSGSIKIGSARGPVSARDSGGDITLGPVGDAVTAQTSSGSVVLKSAKGKVEIRNSGGNISVENVDMAAVLSTSSGNIKVGRAGGKLDIKNSGGSVSVADARDALTVHTSSGQIEVNFAGAPESESRMDVSGGGINVGLPRASGVDIDAKASGGDVVSDLPVTAVVKDSRQHNGIDGKINGGGPLLFLRSSSGNIHIKGTATPSQQAEADK